MQVFEIQKYEMTELDFKIGPCCLKGYWVYIFNPIKNIGRMNQVKV